MHGNYRECVRVIGIDLGSKRIGVAVSDFTGSVASPLTVVHRGKSKRADHDAIARIVRDEPADVHAWVEAALADPAVQVVITTGGTGVTSRDGTYEAVAALFEKRLDGFGELFRALSFQEIGPAAMLSRATAGTVGRRVLFVLPGSEAAVRLAVTKLILPELGHAVSQVRR